MIIYFVFQNGGYDLFSVRLNIIFNEHDEALSTLIANTGFIPVLW